MRTPTILVADDEPLLRWGLREVLDEAGYDTLGATTSAEALEQCKNALVDVVLLDRFMTDGDALQVLAELAQKGRTVILMTAIDAPGLGETAIGLGAHRLLIKPLDLKAVLELVAECVDPACHLPPRSAL